MGAWFTTPARPVAARPIPVGHVQPSAPKSPVGYKRPTALTSEPLPEDYDKFKCDETRQMLGLEFKADHARPVRKEDEACLFCNDRSYYIDDDFERRDIIYDNGREDCQLPEDHGAWYAPLGGEDKGRGWYRLKKQK